MPAVTLRLSLIGLCALFGTAVAAEIGAAVWEDFTFADEAPSGAATQAAKPKGPNPDGMIAGILERPLFSESRAMVEAASDDGDEEVKQPPPLTARLSGVTIRPDTREALFMRGDNKSVALHEGQDIDGWTVESIRLDQVVLSSEFGEKIVEPADGHSTKPAHRAPKKAKPIPVAANKGPAPTKLAPAKSAPTKPAPAREAAR